MKNVSFHDVRLTSGFWADRQRINAERSVRSIYDRFRDTGRVQSFDFTWKEGDPQKPHIFWDSDIAKWLESAAYVLSERKDPALHDLGAALIDRVAEHQGADGYFNTYYTVVEPGKRFTDRNCHELYCAGHMMEAAVAWYEATGERKLLDCMEKYAALIDEKFVRAQTEKFATPGHEEIELALVKMYECTGNERYLRMSETFINNRGRHLLDEDGESVGYAKLKQVQSHLPVREQREAVGHAVRAMYLYCAMADLALRLNDGELKQACIALFESVCRRMYITGGVGSTHIGEAFSVDADLPNDTAYAETCAAIGLCFFARRMQALDPKGRYGDVFERAAYNGVLSGISLDGKAFFYENPLEIPPEAAHSPGVRYPITKRLEVFGCSCCPPNLTRFIAAFGDNLYTVENDDIYLWQFASSEAELALAGGKAKLVQTTDYPASGLVRIAYHGPAARLHVRIPEWCADYCGPVENGFALFDLENGAELELRLPMRPRFVEADPRVLADTGRVAVQFGPVVYCLEAEDNGPWLRDVVLGDLSAATVRFEKEYDACVLEIPAFRHDLGDYGALYQTRGRAALRPFTAKLIPYFAFANRTESEMLVWTQAKG